MPRELKPGDRIKDNDPRMTNRVLVVGTVGTHSCTAKNIHGGKQTTISLDRIHMDEKPRRSGFSLIP